jgi:hypothetical protein
MNNNQNQLVSFKESLQRKKTLKCSVSCQKTTWLSYFDIIFAIILFVIYYILAVIFAGVHSTDDVLLNRSAIAFVVMGIILLIILWRNIERIKK